MGKNHNVPQNNIRNPNFFVAYMTPNERLTEVSSRTLTSDGGGRVNEKKE